MKICVNAYVDTIFHACVNVYMGIRMYKCMYSVYDVFIIGVKGRVVRKMLDSLHSWPRTLGIVSVKDEKSGGKR